jgi:uncharacterized protein
MSAFRVSAAGLRRLATEGTLADRIAEQVWMSGHCVSPAERNSWSRSLSVLAQDLADAGLQDIEVLVEYQLPLTSRRIDAVLAGIHPKTGEDSFVVIELKQWSYATRYEDSDTLVDVEHAAGPRLHPGIQVGDYCQYLTDFLGLLAEHGNAVRGAAYLHNAVDRDIVELFERPATEQSRIFTKQRRGDFLDYLRASLDPTRPGAPAADRFVNSTVRPSRHLLTYAARELKERSHFTLLDEQRVAYELVLHAVERARAADHKSVVVVSGGPGTGKSVIALSLLGELARQGRTALHATGSKSFTQTLRRYAGKGSTRLKNLFLYFNSFMTVDEHQVVKPGELGNVDIITTFARRLNLEVDLVSLHDQFRCGGSEGYEQWVLNLLGLNGQQPAVWEGDGRFDLRIAETPEELESFLAAKQAAGETARMTAGYRWPWSDPRPDETLVNDVKVGAWSRPWNVKSDRSVGDAPGSPFWATDPNGFGQVGCIYTAQGFEYEWSGVIVGPDLVARNGRLVTNRGEFKDPNFRSRNTVSDFEADRLIRNTYKVLMTRGMRGTIIYAADAETRAFLADLVHVRRDLETVYE